MHAWCSETLCIIASNLESYRDFKAITFTSKLGLEVWSFIVTLQLHVPFSVPAPLHVPFSAPPFRMVRSLTLQIHSSEWDFITDFFHARFELADFFIFPPKLRTLCLQLAEASEWVFEDFVANASILSICAEALVVDIEHWNTRPQDLRFLAEFVWDCSILWSEKFNEVTVIANGQVCDIQWACGVLRIDAESWLPLPSSDEDE